MSQCHATTDDVQSCGEILLTSSDEVVGGGYDGVHISSEGMRPISDNLQECDISEYLI